MAFGLFKKKKKETTSDKRYQKLTVKEVVPVAKDAVNIIFEKPEDGFDYKPGQFITIIDNVNGEKLRRAYSLCTTPFIDDNPGVTVKRVANGAMSNHINDNFKSGLEVEVMEPMGMFTTEYNSSNSRKAVFFGGGSGITPLYSIARTILESEPSSELTLIYGNRSVEYVIFKNELEGLAEKNGNFKFIQILEDDEDNLTEYKGRPDAAMIDKIAKDIGLSAQHEVYICGPQPMMDIVQEGLKLADFPEDNIRLESFEAGKTSPQEIIADSEQQQAEASIIIDDERYSLTVEKGTPILEQALKDGIDMPYSCQSGLCTACRGKCVEGEVSVDKAQGLSPEEIEEGYVLTCVGKAVTDRVVIEIG